MLLFSRGWWNARAYAKTKEILYLRFLQNRSLINCITRSRTISSCLLFLTRGTWYLQAVCLGLWSRRIVNRCLKLENMTVSLIKSQANIFALAAGGRIWWNHLRYHGRWIDSVWKSRSYAGALKENIINLYIFWKLNSYTIQPYAWDFLKIYCRSNEKRNTQKHCFALTGSLPRMNNRSGAINIGNVFSHITLQKGVCDFPDVVWFFFYTLLKFDTLNAGVSFH